VHVVSYRFGFLVEQVAGHVTNYKNLRRVVDTDGEVDATWSEIVYHKQGGAFERLTFLPNYVTGIGRATWETHRALRRHRHQALFCNTTVGVFFARSFRRCPTLIDLDSTPIQIDRMPAYESSSDPAPIAKLKWKLTRDMLQAAALVHAWSTWAKHSAVTDYGVAPERVVVNPPGVDLEWWKPRSDPRGAAPRPHKVLFVGGDFKRKGGEVLLAWHAEQDPRKIELHLVTREPVAPRPGVFVYDNMQPNSDALRALYHGSDLFVLPSLGECFGIATVEAMAAGLPVIASDVGGTADIIDSGRNGFIVRAHDAGALGEAIVTILADESRRETMARQSREMAEERFDLQKNARRTIGYLKQVALRSPAAPAVLS
jgi:glycosyltransferase involved in cell wall biosynthesis